MFSLKSKKCLPLKIWGKSKRNIEKLLGMLYSCSRTRSLTSQHQSGSLMNVAVKWESERCMLQFLPSPTADSALETYPVGLVGAMKNCFWRYSLQHYL